MPHRPLWRLPGGWLANLAFGWGADQIKVGSAAHTERLAKYNRLLAIGHDTGLPEGDLKVLIRDIRS